MVNSWTTNGEEGWISSMIVVAAKKYLMETENEHENDMELWQKRPASANSNKRKASAVDDLPWSDLDLVITQHLDINVLGFSLFVVDSNLPFEDNPINAHADQLLAGPDLPRESGRLSVHR